MLRFNLGQLMRVVILVAILIGLTQTDGCGHRFSQIECLDFSRDGSHLVVSRLDARDARTPLKGYLSNVSRTISIIDLSDGLPRSRVLKGDLRRGNRGTAFRLWRIERTSVAYLSDDAIIAHEFGGGSVVVYSTVGGHATRELSLLGHPVYNLAVTGDGTRVAASGVFQVSLVDVDSGTVTHRWVIEDLPFLRASLLAFSEKNDWLAVGGGLGVHLCQLDAPAATPSTVLEDSECSIEAITFLPDDSLLVASGQWLRQYDTAGSIVQSFSETESYFACSASSDGARIAASTRGAVKVYDVHSGWQESAFECDRATAVAFTPDATKLAIGDRNGTLTLVDAMSGKTVWTVRVAGRYRLPWTLPGAMLVILCYVEYRIRRRIRIASIRNRII